MILVFSSLDTLRRAIAENRVSRAAWLAPARGAIDADGRIWIEPQSPLDGDSASRLTAIGVSIDPPNPPELTDSVADWLALVPLMATADDVSPSAVLIEFRDGRSFIRMSTELRRLGHLAQSFAFTRDGRVFMRVGQPPYAILWHATGRTDEGDPRAYVEQSAGIWVEIGFRHPFAEHLPSPRRALCLLRPRRQRELVTPRPFRPMVAPGSLVLPQLPLSCFEANDRHSIPISPTVVPAPRAEPATMWLFDVMPRDRLAMMVHSASEEILDRLEIAAGRSNGREIILLRAKRDRRDPPVLVTETAAFVSWLRVPNLLVPVGHSINPPLRRDSIRQMYAADPHRITWLNSASSGGVVAESIDDVIFVPLADQIEYTLDHAIRRLAPVSPSSPFGWEAFQTAGDRPPAPADDLAGDDNATELPQNPLTRIIKAVRGMATRRRRPEPAPTTARIEPALLTPSEREQRLADRVREFRQLTGPPDDPSRVALWPELADASAAVGHHSDAAICWLAAIWAYDQPSRNWVDDWLHNERKANAETQAALRLEAILRSSVAPQEDVRFVAATVIAASLEPDQGIWKCHGPALAQCLERHDHLIPIRGAWLAWLAMDQLSGGDHLALARARDRLLQRLLTVGLGHDLDLPSFMRGPTTTGNRFGADRAGLQRLRDTVRPRFAAFDRTIVDLTLAFGLARIGEAFAASNILDEAARLISETDTATTWLFNAYRTRINQVLKQQADDHPMSSKLRQSLHGLPPPVQEAINLRRRASRILEPFEAIDPFRSLRHHRDDSVGIALSSLQEVTNDRELLTIFTDLLRRYTEPRPRLRILGAAIRYAPRLGESFAVEVLSQLDPVLTWHRRDWDLFGVVDVIDAALLLAVHAGRNEFVTPLIEHLRSLLLPLSGERAAWVIGRFGGLLYRTLGKVGARDLLQPIIERMAEQLLGEGGLERLRSRPAVNWGIVLKALTQLAGGWYYLDHDDRAIEIVDEIRTRLFARTLRAEEQTDLAVAYASLLGLSPPATAWERISDLCMNLGCLSIPGTVNTHVHQIELRTFEAAILAVTSTDFSTGGAIRKWLDEDEYVVRRRIHRDYHQRTTGGATTRNR
jgi:hypothetical protein